MKTNLLKTLLSFITLFGSPVGIFSQGNCYPDQTPQYWKIDESLYGSRLLSACSPAAYYNCHGFAMSYVEIPQSQDCQKPSWINSVASPYLCPNPYGRPAALVYQNSAKYIQVCLESDASIVYYQFLTADHSAVKTVTNGQIKYISKYDYNGPLVAHNLMGSVYHLKGQDIGIPVQFWAYAGSISGNTNINGIIPVTFNVNNIQNINYYWSILSGYSNIYISSSATQYSATLVPTHSGTAVLQLNISSGCSGPPKTQQITLNIATNICLEGVYDNAGIYNQNLNTVNRVSVGGVAIRVSCPNSTLITWEKTSGNVNGYFPTTGPSASFNMTAGGSISLLLTAKNGSTTIGTRSITFYNY